MKEYILQEGVTDDDPKLVPDVRVFLDDRKHKRTTVLEVILAESWRDARTQVIG